MFYCQYAFLTLNSQNDDTRSVEIINKATLSKISALESELDQARSEIFSLKSGTNGQFPTVADDSLRLQNEVLQKKVEKLNLSLKERCSYFEVLRVCLSDSYSVLSQSTCYWCSTSVVRSDFQTNT